MSGWDFAARGFSLFPVVARSKNPAIDKWEPFQTRRASSEEIAAWSAHPYNTGVATGAVSGCIVLDCDSAPARTLALAQGIPDTLTVSTPRGTHFYFRHPGWKVSNRAGREWTKEIDGVGVEGWDLRGDGGYVVGPGSHYVPSPAEAVKGKVEGKYRIEHDVPMADAPDWLLALTFPRAHKPNGFTTSTEVTTTYGRAALSAEITKLIGTGPGNLNNQINLSAYALGQLVGGGMIAEWEALDALWEAICTLGVEDDGKAPGTVTRAFEAGKLKPRGAEQQEAMTPEQALGVRQAGSFHDRDALCDLAPRNDCIETLDLARLATVDPIPKRFIIPKLAPAGEVTLFTGPGSAGKSLLGQQLATALAMGRPTLGLDMGQAAAIYLTCEDDKDQLHWRQHHICRALGGPMNALAGKLWLASLRGHLDNALGVIGANGGFTLGTAYHRLVTLIRSTGANLVFLDNLAHLFTGNENHRGEVTHFVNALNRMAGETGAAIVLLAHTNKAFLQGNRQGNTHSGSTAWLNSVRSQFTIEHDLETDRRTLTLGKANYSRNGEELRFVWQDWAFALESDLSPDAVKALSETIKANGENAAFMECLGACTKQRRNVSHQHGSNYAPKVFAAMPEANGIRRAGFTAAMERLIHMGKIELDADLWQGSNRHPKRGIKAVTQGAE